MAASLSEIVRGIHARILGGNAPTTKSPDQCLLIEDYPEIEGHRGRLANCTTVGCDSSLV
jgi:hypothetical protein